LSEGRRPPPDGDLYGSAGSSTPTRIAALAALLVAIALVLIVFLGGDSGYSYRLYFETGGQLVPGNQVQVGGHPIGTVDEIELTDDWQAEVSISVDEELHEGTAAVIRTTSLSGIANRYIAVTPGPDDGPALADGDVITAQDTISPVDLDQLFDTFRPKQRRALRNVIQGFGTAYTGSARAANETYKYLNPGLSTAQRLFAELTRDQQAFSDFLVDGSRVVGAIAERRDDLSALTQNANEALGAIARENDALDRTLVALPPALRQASTTFVNLRAALDDLDPLVETSKVATRDLAPFLRDLRPVARESVPVFRNLREVVLRKGTANDLADTLGDLPKLRDRARVDLPRASEGLEDSLPIFQFARPYSPELLGLISRIGQAAAYYDQNGHYARASVLSNIFNYGAGGTLTPNDPSQQYDFYDANPLGSGNFVRCPGGATQPITDSNPFTDDGNLLSGGQAPNPKCNTADVPPGP
jgi:phospholipid/cholesterol/gamma-HCH transport system substrate-binding protein